MAIPPFLNVELRPAHVKTGVSLSIFDETKTYVYKKENGLIDHSLKEILTIFSTYFKFVIFYNTNQSILTTLPDFLFLTILFLFPDFPHLYFPFSSSTTESLRVINTAINIVKIRIPPNIYISSTT